MARILILLQPPDGGVFQHVQQLCEGLTSHGHEPVVGGPFESPQPGLAAEVVPLAMVRSIAPAQMPGRWPRWRASSAACGPLWCTRTAPRLEARRGSLE